MKRSSGSFWGALLLVLGVLFLLENMGVLSVQDVIRQFWPLLIILAGVRLLMTDRGGQETPPRKRSSKAEVTVHRVAGDVHEEFSADTFEAESVFGDQSLVCTSATCKWVTSSSVIGDIRLDLRGMRPFEGECVVRLSGVIGDLKVLLPSGIPVAIGAHSLLGCVEANGEHHDGFSSTCKYRSEGYDRTVQRLHIQLSSVLGDITVFS
jgi:lia operon protein LiaF